MFRQALRSLLHRRTYSLLSLALLTLGVGAVGAIFAIVNATLLEPLPYRDPGRLYALTVLQKADGDSASELPLSLQQFVRWREQSRAFDGIEIWTPTNPKLTGDGDPESLRGATISSGLFDLLGARPLVGRAFARADELPGSNVALISYGYWQRRFGGDRSVVGRVVTIDDQPTTIVGVMPEHFSLRFQQSDLWKPIVVGEVQLGQRNLRIWATVARLRAGATLRQAADEMRVINDALAAEFPDAYRGIETKTVTLADSIFGSSRRTLFLLLAAVMLVLLIAATNVLNLASADAIARSLETMTRLALGATRPVIFATRVREGVAIGVAAGLLGLAVAAGLLAALRWLNPDVFTLLGPVVFDVTVVAFVLVVALGAAICIMLPVAAREASFALDGLAGAAIRGVGGVTERRSRDALLAGQVAVTLVLLLGTALLVRSYRTLMRQSPGFIPSNVLVTPMTMSTVTYTTPTARAAHLTEMLAAVRAVPGVEAVSNTQTRFVLTENMQSALEVEDQPPKPGELRLATIRHVGPDIARALGLRMLQGRAIDSTDREGTPMVAMVSAAFVRRYWPHGSAIGQRIRRGGSTNPWLEIVGVFDDVKDAGVGLDLGPTMYVSYLQRNTATARVTLVVRTRASGDQAALSRAIRQAVWSVDRSQTIETIRWLDDLQSRSSAQPRFAAVLVSLFGGAALALVLAGIYAMTLHSVLRRTRELGVRAALGARPSELMQLTLRQGLRPVIVGLLAGVALCVPAVWWLEKSLTEGVTAADIPLGIAVALLVIAGTASAAAWAGRRVLRIDPMVAMRG